MAMTTGIGVDAIKSKGWLGAHRWLLLRRVSQAGVLLLFLLGPWFDWWLIKGNIVSSRVLDTVPLSDPLVLLQTLMAGHPLTSTALIGGLIVTAFYLLVGGRVYCSWVCPVNPITDLANWLRTRLGLRGGSHPPRSTRYALLVMVLLLPLVTGSLAWELINPVSAVFRGLVYGMGLTWGVVLAVLLLDLLMGSRLWCGRFCPVGAFYGLLGRFALLRVSAARREQCDDCMDCFAVCPESQVIKPALKGAPLGNGPVVLAGDCTNCGRCIDVCAKDVFLFSTRFHNHMASRVMSNNGGLVP